MKLATIKTNGTEVGAIVVEDRMAPLAEINRSFGCDYPIDLLQLLESGRLDELTSWYNARQNERETWERTLLIPLSDVDFAPLYRRPHKIWGIGLNYVAHASDLDEKVPLREPASFMKPDTSIIGHRDTIQLPLMSDKITGEAEMGLVFGRRCKDVGREEWKTVLAGFCCIIDMTAEDILRRNPRNLTQSKSFDTFFSFGPVLYTVDELEDVSNLEVRTVINGKVHAKNVISNMTFPPDELVSYHTRLMTMLPGDVISSGTPGAVRLAHGDQIECHVDGFLPLVNNVVDLKVSGDV